MRSKGRTMKSRGNVPKMAELRRLAQSLGFDAEVFMDVYDTLHACWSGSHGYQAIRIEATASTAKRAMAAALRELGKGKP